MSKEDLLDKFYASVPSFVFDRSYIHSAQGYMFFLNIMDEYAKECVKRSLAKAASNAKIISNTCVESNMGFSPCCNVKVDSSSICNDKNEVYSFNSENKYERAINKILDMQQSKSIGDLHVGDKVIDGEIAVKMFNDALELIKYIIRKELKNEAVTYVIYTDVEKLVEVRRVFLTEKEYDEELTNLNEGEKIVTLNAWSTYKSREIDITNRMIDDWDDL